MKGNKRGLFIDTCRVYQSGQDDHGRVGIFIECQDCGHQDFRGIKPNHPPDHVGRVFRRSGWEVDARGRRAQCPRCLKRKKKAAEDKKERPQLQVVAQQPRARERTVIAQQPRARERTVIPARPSPPPDGPETRTVADTAFARSGSTTLGAPAVSEAVGKALESVLRKRVPRTEVRDALRLLLAGSPSMLATEVIEQITQRIGCSDSAVHRAAGELVRDGALRKAKRGYQGAALWEWIEGKPAKTEKPKETKAMTTKETPSKEAMRRKREMFRLLEEHFNPESGLYAKDWGDERIAKETHLSLDHVKETREGAFGTLNDPLVVEMEREIAKLRKHMEDFRAMAKRRLEKAVKEMEAQIERDVEGLRALLESIEKRLEERQQVG